MALRSVDPAGRLIPEGPFRELQSTVGRMERVLASVPSGLLWLDAAGRIKWCNESLAAIAGRERLGLLGQHIAASLPLRREGRPLEGDDHPLVRAIRERRGLDAPFEAGPPGAERALRVCASFASHEGDESFLSVSVLDVTESVAAARVLDARSAELREAVAEHESFTYSVAHDLRAPLRAIRSFGQILSLEASAALPERARGLLTRILTAAARMDALITDLLAFSHLARREIQLGPVEAEAVVDRVVAALSDETRAREGTVRIERPIPPAFGHAGLLEQALTNLVANALKFAAPGTKPSVRVRGETRGSRTRLWVEDDGIGIEPRFQEQIFQVFKRLHTPDEYPGTGIGLAIVSRAMARSGGACGVESRLGAGSRFWLELPAVAPHA